MAVKAQASITISRLVDISSVTRYYLLQSSTSAAPAKPTTNPPHIGKNVFDISVQDLPYDVANGTLIEETENGIIVQGDQGVIPGSMNYSSGWYRPGVSTTNMYLKTGSIVTISADYTVLEFGSNNTDKRIGIYLTPIPADDAASLYGWPPVDTANQTYRVSVTFTITKDSLYYPVFTLNSNKVKIENIQIELGSTATEYQKYVSPNWVATEPSYTSGSTNTLYFVDCTEFTNGTFKYSEVSKSSSYEAAKEAYNKAAAVETRVTNAETAIEQNKTAITLRATKTEVTNYVASRGENLVTNGTALLGDNTNFSGFTYDGSETYYSGGSFKAEGKKTIFTDEYIPVDVSQTYMLSCWMKSNSTTATYYDFLDMYDIDKNRILAPHVMYIAGSLTTLSQELKNGDTVVHLQSVAGFSKSETMSGRRGLIFWNYKNSKGYQYSPETYSRNYVFSIWDDASAFDTTNNTITLNKAWSKGTFPAGTAVSQSNAGGGYIYFQSNYKFAAANTWTRMSGALTGVGKNNEPGKFREGTAFVRVGWLLNYNNVASVITHISTVSLTQNAGIATVDNTVLDLQDAMNTQKNDIIDSCNSNITDALEDYVQTGDYEAYKETVTASLELLANQIQMQFETTSESLSSIDGDMQTRFTELSKYIRFSIDGIEIGGSEDSLKLRLDDDLIRFEKNGETLGWWDGVDFHTGNIKIDVTERAQFGNFAFVPRSDGSLMFLKVDNVVGEVHCPDLTDVDIVRASWWEPLPGHGIRVHTTAGTQSIVNPRDITYDATKKYRITYTSKNAKISCYGDYDENMVQSELCTKSTDGVNNITVDGLYEFRFENVDTSITEYSINDMRIVEVN